MRRVSSREVPVGSAIVADFTKVVLAWRELANVLASDQGPCLFDSNMILLRGELRIAVAVTTPPAFAIADLTAV